MKTMLDRLDFALGMLPSLMEFPEQWESLVINRRKPFTYRAFLNVGGYRICLHRFETCDEHEAFYHPHPWPGAFAILKGSYWMKLGYSKDRFTLPDHVAHALMTAGSKYSIENPMTWHTVEPQSEVFTVMVNGAPWPADVAHKEVRTTKGKDLAKMTPDELKAHFDTFGALLTPKS